VVGGAPVFGATAAGGDVAVPEGGVLATGAFNRLLGGRACFGPGAPPALTEGTAVPVAGDEAVLVSGVGAAGGVWGGSAVAGLEPPGAAGAAWAGSADVSGARMSLCAQAATTRRIGTEASHSRCMRHSVAFARRVPAIIVPVVPPPRPGRQRRAVMGQVPSGLPGIAEPEGRPWQTVARRSPTLAVSSAEARGSGDRNDRFQQGCGHPAAAIASCFLVYPLCRRGRGKKAQRSFWLSLAPSGVSWRESNRICRLSL